MPQAAGLGVTQAPELDTQPEQLDVGARSLTVATRSTPVSSVTRVDPSPTVTPLRRPVTWTSAVSPPHSSRRRIRTDVLAARTSPGASGRTAGSNRAPPSTTAA
jgi:hypothetical protein